MRPFSFILPLLLAFIFTANAQTPISTDFYNDDTLRKSNSPYIITKNIAIFQNVTLYIEPGVTVYFNNSKISLRGAIIASGTATDSIRLVSQSAQQDTALFIQKNDKGHKYQLYLKNCVAENFKKVIIVDRYNYDVRGDFFMKHCNFRNNYFVFMDRPGALYS